MIKEQADRQPSGYCRLLLMKNPSDWLRSWHQASSSRTLAQGLCRASSPDSLSASNKCTPSIFLCSWDIVGFSADDHVGRILI